MARGASGHDSSAGLGGPGARPTRHVGPCDRPPACLMKVAYFSPLPPERSGIADYSALLLPRARAPPRRPRRKARDPAPAAWHGRRAVPRRQQPGSSRVDRRSPPTEPRARCPPRFRPPPSRRRADVGSGDPDAYLEAMEVDGGVVGRLLAHGVIDGLIPPALGDPTARLSARRLRPLRGRRTDRAFGVRRGKGPRGGLPRTDLANPDAGLA